MDDFASGDEWRNESTRERHARWEREYGTAEPGEFNSSRPIDGDRTDKLFPTIAALLDMDLSPPDFMVDGLVPMGGIIMLGSKPDVGKSTLLRTLTVSRSRGMPWLGRSVKQGSVLLCQFEEIPTFARDHLVLMGATRDMPIFPFFEPCLGDFMERLTDWAHQHREALIIIDTLGKVAPGKDLLDYNIATQVLTPFVTLARTTGAGIVLSHHNKKGESYDPADDLLGSTAIRANMDHTLAITQSGETRIIQTVSKRYGESMPSTYLDLDPYTGRVEAGDTVKEKKGQDMEAEIMAVLQDGPLTAVELEGRITGKSERIRRTRDAMVERGDICRERVGRAHKYCLSVPSHS
ncbi:MAG: AAA family ATPase [Alphaproteobacteria bacterium]|nr:AAA family ATPase [Alphaproteobacteria bacterium]